MSDPFLTTPPHGILHVYAQTRPHANMDIIGNQESLVALKEAIENALSNRESTFITMTSDGEFYESSVFWVEKAEIDTLKLPYTNVY